MLGRLAAFALAAALAGPALAAGETFGCPAGGPDATVGGPGATADARGTQPGDPFTRPEETVPATKRTARGLYLTAVDAFEMVSEQPAKVLFIDVRTRGELQFIGMPAVVDANVPILIEAVPLQWDATASGFKLVPNPDFVAAVDQRLAQKGLTRDAPVVVICQAGLRAVRAVNLLTQAGYTTAYTVIDGFEGDPVVDGPAKGQRLVNGWRNAGLPWTAKLDRAKMYGLD